MKIELANTPSKPRRISRIWLYGLAGCLALAWLAWLALTGGWAGIVDHLSTFTTILLGIAIEAAPFLLLGSLASGLVEVFLVNENMGRWAPRNPVLGAMTGALMGLFFPVCECGVVPLTRRLFQKGLPAPVGIAFLMGAPALNPVVIVSTLAAFGWGPVLWGRLALTFIIATAIGVVFSLEPDASNLLQRSLPSPIHADERLLAGSGPLKPGEKWLRVLNITGDEFFEIGRYLILGASLAGILQTVVPQAALLGVSRGPIISVLVMILLAVLLSVCSTVDAFIALSFAGTFTTGSVLAFLVFGPMVDIKSTLMFLHVLRRKSVIYMILFALLLTVLFTVFINLNVNL